MPVRRRIFGAGESPRLSQVEPQGAVEFQYPPNSDFVKTPAVLNANQPERRIVTIDQSPNLDYAWAISQISVPVMTILNLLGPPPEGFYVPPPTMNVKGFAGSQIIFSNPSVSGEFVALAKTHASITTYLIDLTPFTPYPIRGGQQVSIQFELNTNTFQVAGFNWQSQTLIGYAPSFITGEAGGVPNAAQAISYPGILSYRYV